MKPSTRMMLLAGRKDKSGYENDRNRDREDWGRSNYDHDGMPENRYGGERMATGGRGRRYDYSRGGRIYNGGYEDMPYVDGAFYDRDGRRHYDDGRYAPMDAIDYPDVAPRQYPYRGMRYDNGRMNDEPYRRNNMGFARYGEGYTFEMGSDGDKIHGNVIPIREQHKKHSKEEFEPLTKETAMQWAKSMKNEDGTTGPHWTIEQTTKVMKDLKEDFDEIDFFLAMNATYSDLSEEFKKHGINKPEAYADFAIAFWLCDEDAVEDKLSAYYEFITK